MINFVSQKDDDGTVPRVELRITKVVNGIKDRVLQARIEGKVGWECLLYFHADGHVSKYHFVPTTLGFRLRDNALVVTDD
jgi:hypothetical protein